MSDEEVVRNFRTVRIVIILTEKNVANISDKDSGGVTDQRWKTGWRSRSLLMGVSKLARVGLEAEGEMKEELYIF
jgi:hypothetical protein